MSASARSFPAAWRVESRIEIMVWRAIASHGEESSPRSFLAVGAGRER